MDFCNFLEIKAETKKVVRVKVVPFGVLYSCVQFRRLKMGDPVYIFGRGLSKKKHFLIIFSKQKLIKIKKVFFCV